jgi:hypothetical protein
MPPIGVEDLWLLADPPKSQGPRQVVTVVPTRHILI